MCLSSLHFLQEEEDGEGEEIYPAAEDGMGEEVGGEDWGGFLREQAAAAADKARMNDLDREWVSEGPGEVRGNGEMGGGLCKHAAALPHKVAHLLVGWLTYAYC